MRTIYLAVFAICAVMIAWSIADVGQRWPVWLGACLAGGYCVSRFIWK